MVAAESVRRAVRSLGAWIGVATLALANPAAADVLWSWSFGTESGTFVTTGSFAETAAPGVFTFRRFWVSASQVASNVGAGYVDQNPVATMTWNGTQPTQFARGSGSATNGSNFARFDGAYVYTLEVPASILFQNPGEHIALEATLTVTPLGPFVATAAAPALSPLATAATALLLAALASAALRRRGPTLLGAKIFFP